MNRRSFFAAATGLLAAAAFGRARRAVGSVGICMNADERRLHESLARVIRKEQEIASQVREHSAGELQRTEEETATLREILDKAGPAPRDGAYCLQCEGGAYRWRRLETCEPLPLATPVHALTPYS